ncbi:MAG: putative aminohydrolase SsnA [Candidatus Cloacimonetes bacterium]|nr:putative aminohydrolase SsnA [Candidatus Cloacimonadota bacterium]
MRIKIIGGIIITLDYDNMVLYNHDVIINDEIIESIVPTGRPSGDFDTTIDASGKVVMPGYINAHMHFYSTMVRGLGKAKPADDFIGVLENLWWRLDKKLTLEDVYLSTQVMLLEAIKKGCTTFIDHHASPYAVSGSLDEIEKAFKNTGLRGCLCYELSDRDGDKIAAEGLRENARFIRKCAGNQSQMMSALFGLHASFTLSDKSLDEAVRLSSEFDAGFHVHVAEAESDQITTKKLTGKSVVRRLYDAGVLGKKTIAAHCIHISDEERRLLAETDTIVVHNPQSNLNNAVGIADTLALARQGILTGLGTDAMTVDMPQELRVALWAQHFNQNNPTCGFMETADLLYKNNAVIAGRVFDGLKTGILKEGFAADVILCDYFPPTPLDNSTALGHLIFGISEAVVDTTICNGRILMLNQKIQLDLDENEICERSRELSRQLWERF